MLAKLLEVDLLLGCIFSGMRVKDTSKVDTKTLTFFTISTSLKLVEPIPEPIL